MIDRFLPLPFPGPPSTLPRHSLFPRLLTIEDPAPGKYELKIDGKTRDHRRLRRMEGRESTCGAAPNSSRRGAASRDQPQERTVLLPLAAAEHHVSPWLPQARARKQRRRDPAVRPAGRRAGKDHRAAQEAGSDMSMSCRGGEGGGSMKRPTRWLDRVSVAGRAGPRLRGLARRLRPSAALSDPRSRPRDRAEIVRGRRWLRGQSVRGRPA